ncbi:MAG: hypothetical protein Q9165_007304 [Trypethelium subeluteriae]
MPNLVLTSAEMVISDLVLSGTSVLSFTASPVLNYSINTAQGGDYAAMNLTNLNFCNASISYTHPGENDTINTVVWLPLSGWNGRFQGTGGGGYETGESSQVLAPALNAGYAAASTDGGHSEGSYAVAPWALVSPHNVNQYLLQDFASVSLHEMAMIGKQVIESVYGEKPKYSYWNGCSTGGRQGFMLAQRYPNDFDGILAMSPAINWDSFAVTDYYPQLIMNELDYFPTSCELDAITAAAISACDGLDGVIDSIISLPNECHFDPHTLVGAPYTCNGTNSTVTHSAATIALAAWTGSHSSTGLAQWPGLNRDATLTSPYGISLGNTNCTSPNASNSSSPDCTGIPFFVTQTWLSTFLLGLPASTPLGLLINHTTYDALLHLSRSQYASIIGTSDPDLSLFGAAGGKLLSWHGLADPLIPPTGSADYFARVLDVDSKARDYFRLFEAPGTGHCAPGNGPYPQDVLGRLVEWVEGGEAPEVLEAVGMAEGSNGTVARRRLCAWPKVQRYVGGDPNEVSSFECQ